MFNIISICKGGGYQYCRTEPKHPKANSKGLYPLHRVLVENHLGRLLDNNEQVHHKDEDKFNNTIENLEVLSISEHARLHSPSKTLVNLICPFCKSSFHVKEHLIRLRTGRNKSGKIFCSRSCSTKMTYNSNKNKENHTC